MSQERSTLLKIKITFLDTERTKNIAESLANSRKHKTSKVGQELSYPHYVVSEDFSRGPKRFALYMIILLSSILIKVHETESPTSLYKPKTQSPT